MFDIIMIYFKGAPAAPPPLRRTPIISFIVSSL